MGGTASRQSLTSDLGSRRADSDAESDDSMELVCMEVSPEGALEAARAVWLQYLRQVGALEPRKPRRIVDYQVARHRPKSIIRSPAAG